MILSADLLIPKEGGYEVSKQLVKNKKVDNPVDNNLSKYEVGGNTAKENVSLLNDSAEKIAKNTDIFLRDLVHIQSVAKQVSSLNRYEQITEGVLNSDNFDALQKRQLPLAISKLQKARNVKLN